MILVLSYNYNTAGFISLIRKTVKEKSNYMHFRNWVVWFLKSHATLWFIHLLN